MTSINIDYPWVIYNNTVDEYLFNGSNAKPAKEVAATRQPSERVHYLLSFHLRRMKSKIWIETVDRKSNDVPRRQENFTENFDRRSKTIRSIPDPDRRTLHLCRESIQ